MCDPNFTSDLFDGQLNALKQEPDLLSDTYLAANELSNFPTGVSKAQVQEVVNPPALYQQASQPQVQKATQQLKALQQAAQVQVTSSPLIQTSPIRIQTQQPSKNLLLQSQLAQHLIQTTQPKQQKIIVQQVPQASLQPQQIIINAQPQTPQVQTVGQVNLQQLQQVSSFNIIL